MVTARGGHPGVSIQPPPTPAPHAPRSSAGRTRCVAIGGASIPNVGKGTENQDTYVTGSSPTGTKCLAGVFDGHGEKGGRISHFAREVLSKSFFDHQDLHNDPKKALTSAYIEAQRQIEKKHAPDAADSGTTAVVAYQYRDQLIVANVGDSRAVLGRFDAARGGLDAVELSRDHKPSRADERARIVAAGGKIDQGCFPMPASAGRVRWQRAGPERITDKSGLGGLAVSRTLGDLNMRPFVSSSPEVTERKLDACDKFVVLGSDGVWDQVSSKEAVDIVGKYTDATLAANEITGVARQRWRAQTAGQLADDITVVVVRLDTVASPPSPSTPRGNATARHASATVRSPQPDNSNTLDAVKRPSSRPHKERPGSTLVGASPYDRSSSRTGSKTGGGDDSTRPWTHSSGHRSVNLGAAAGGQYPKRPAPPTSARGRTSSGRPRR